MIELTCPSCGTAVSSNAPNARIAIERLPQEGDYALCLHCGEISIFSEERANLRRTSEAEELELEQDKEIRSYRNAWRAGALKIR
jgi:hypothetical protein